VPPQQSKEIRRWRSTSNSRSYSIIRCRFCLRLLAGGRLGRLRGKERSMGSSGMSAHP